MNKPVVTSRSGVGRCRQCGISPQLVKEGRCLECWDRAPQLQLKVNK